MSQHVGSVLLSYSTLDDKTNSNNYENKYILVLVLDRKSLTVRNYKLHKQIVTINGIAS